MKIEHNSYLYELRVFNSDDIYSLDVEFTSAYNNWDEFIDDVRNKYDPNQLKAEFKPYQLEDSVLLYLKENFNIIDVDEYWADDDSNRIVKITFKTEQDFLYFKLKYL